MTQVTTPQIAKDASGDTSRQGEILWSEVESTILEAQPLDGQLPIHGGNYDFSRPKFDSSVDDEDVSRLDSGVTHGITVGPYENGAAGLLMSSSLRAGARPR